MRSLIAMTIGMSCSMIRIDDPSSRWIVVIERAEGLGLLLRDTGGGLVEEDELRVERDQAAELDDAARARSTAR